MSAASDTSNIRLAGRTFSIPQRYQFEIPGWLQRLQGLDDSSREMSLTIGAAEVAASVVGYETSNGAPIADLILRVVVLTDQEVQRYLNQDRFADIWNSAGSYRERIIEPDVTTSFFRAYRRSEYPNSWEVLALSPATAAVPLDPYSYWIGHCLRLVGPPDKPVQCRSDVLIGDVSVQFTTTEQNVARIPAIREYLAGLVRHWQN